MALEGTLKDFGIADIFQLIGQQQKTGQLMLKSKRDAVTVSFADGVIVRAETESRLGHDRIGRMLVDGGLITDDQLDAALARQKRTLQLLGDILVDQGHLSKEKLREVAQLQSSETLYRLFNWKTGNYAFEQLPVEPDSTIVPMRPESVLMEGFRRVDEWPLVRKRITSLQMTFERLKELPPEKMRQGDNGDPFESEGSGEFRSIGRNERVCFDLVQPGRTVARIVQLSGLGEFETAKSLSTLVGLDFLKGFPAKSAKGRDFESYVQPSTWMGVALRTAIVIGVVVTLVVLATQVGVRTLRLTARNATRYSDPATERFASQNQLSRLRAAMAVYQLETGGLPPTLHALADVQLVDQSDLAYPWRDEFFYRPEARYTEYTLLPPLR